MPDSIQANAASAAASNGGRAGAGPAPRPVLAAAGFGEDGRAPGGEAVRIEIAGAERPKPRGRGGNVGERVVPAGQGGEQPGQCQGVDRQPLVARQCGKILRVVPGAGGGGEGAGQGVFGAGDLRGGIEPPGQIPGPQRQVVGVHPGVVRRQPAGGFPQRQPGDQPAAHRIRRGFRLGVEAGQSILGGGERGEQVFCGLRRAAGPGRGPVRPAIPGGVRRPGWVVRGRVPDRPQQRLGLQRSFRLSLRIRIGVPEGVVGAGHGGVSPGD